MKADTDTKDPDRFNAQQNADDNRNIQYDKRNDKAFTRSYRISLRKTAEFIASKSGMKYSDLTEIGKGAMITTRKASHIAWKSKTVYDLLRSPPQPDTLAYEIEKCLKMRLSPHKRLKGIFVLQYL